MPRTIKRLSGGILAGMAAAILLAAPAVARTLAVGAGQAFAVPSQAAAVAGDGDVVQIAAGTYYDCAIWHGKGVTIAGAGPQTVITDTTCQGKALFIIGGEGTTVRDLTLARARVLDGNGAGIRMEGPSLTLQHVRFINNEVGILAGSEGPRRLRIADCLFESGGVGGDHPMFAVVVGTLDVLQIERSTISDVKGGGIESSAASTELTGNSIATGSGADPAPAVLIEAGNLLMQDNVISLGPVPSRQRAAVWATGGGNMVLRHNELHNATGRPAALLLDWSGGKAVLEDNKVGSGDTERSISGLWRHRASALAHAVIRWRPGH